MSTFSRRTFLGLTGVAGTCPLYSVLGISTCPVKKAS